MPRGRHAAGSGGRGQRRRGRAETPPASERFPLTVPGFDDAWVAPADPGGTSQWWLEVDEDVDGEAPRAPAPRTRRPRMALHLERSHVIDRYAPSFDLPVVTVDPPAGQVGAASPEKTSWMAPEEDDVPGAHEPGDPPAAAPSVLTEDVPTAEHQPVREKIGEGPLQDTGEDLLEAHPGRSHDVDDAEADSADDGEADGGRRYVFLEAATRYATGAPGSEVDAEGADDRTEDDATEPVGMPVWAPDRRRPGRRRAALVGVPLVLLAAAGTAWAAAMSESDRPSVPAAAPTRATTTTTTSGFTFDPVTTLLPTAPPGDARPGALDTPTTTAPTTTTTRPTPTTRPPVTTTSTAPASIVPVDPPTTSAPPTTASVTTTTTTRPPTTTTTAAPTTTTTVATTTTTAATTTTTTATPGG